MHTWQKTRPSIIGWKKSKAGLILPVYSIEGAGDWSLGGEEIWRGDLLSTFTAEANTTPNASAHVKGVYNTIIPSTPIEANGLYITINPTRISNRTMTDMAVGAAGSEQLIAANLFAHQGTSDRALTTYYFLPVHVPIGSRIACRSQQDQAQAVIVIDIALFAGGPNSLFVGGSKINTYGDVPASTTGTTLTTGTGGAKGAWVQLSASTLGFTRWLVLACMKASVVSTRYNIDIGIGASTAEKIIFNFPALGYRADVTHPSIQAIGAPISIPPDTRLSARASTDDAGSRTIDVILYGVAL